jgi:hypothetical protein
MISATVGDSSEKKTKNKIEKKFFPFSLFFFLREIEECKK